MPSFLVDKSPVLALVSFAPAPKPSLAAIRATRARLWINGSASSLKDPQVGWSFLNILSPSRSNLIKPIEHLAFVLSQSADTPHSTTCTALRNLYFPDFYASAQLVLAPGLAVHGNFSDLILKQRDFLIRIIALIPCL
eukprot:s3914_g8.t1